MKRIAYFDYLRGIAILMVVAIHTYAVLPFTGGLNIFSILVRQVIGCAVPMFLALSGFLLGVKDITTFEQKISFWGKQIPKVYIPALLWSIPLFILSLVNGDSGIVKAVTKLLFMGFSVYYFIALIIQCYLLLPLLQKTDYTKWGGVICLISIICGVVIAWFGGNQLLLAVYAVPCVTWLVFFCQGIVLGRSQRDYNIKYLIVGILFSIILMMLETYFLKITGKSGEGLKPSVYIYSILIIYLLFSKQLQVRFKEGKLLNRLICYIGKISFAIYLIHCFLIMFAKTYFTNWPWICKWLLIVISSVVIIFIVRKILPDKLLKIIGFK